MDRISLGSIKYEIPTEAEINDMGWVCISCGWLNHQSDSICSNCGTSRIKK